MKIKIKKYLKIERPIYPLLFMIFMFSIPYLIPLSENYRFKYTKFYNTSQHIKFCILLSFIIFLVYLISKLIKSNNIKDYYEGYTKKIYRINSFIIKVSILMNCVLIVHGTLYLIQGNNLDSVKNVYSFYKGINIISQFYLIPLLINININININEKRFKTKRILNLFIIISIRAILFSERLALMELIVSAIVLFSMKNYIKINVKKCLIMLTMIGGFLLFNQAFRQYEMLKESENYTFIDALEESKDLLVSYYADTTNKFYFEKEYDMNIVSADQTLFYTINRVKYRLGIPSNSKISYGYEMLDYYNGRDKRLTNPGGLTQYYADFNSFYLFVFGIHIFLFIFIYNKAKSGNYFAIGMYGYMYLSILELPRFNFLYLTRFTIPTLFYMFIYFTFVTFNKNN